MFLVVHRARLEAGVVIRYRPMRGNRQNLQDRGYGMEIGCLVAYFRVAFFSDYPA